MTDLIALSDISKQYGSIRILDHFFLRLAPGEFVIITGSSGSGKSTLLYLIGLLDDRFTGNYRLFDKDVRQMSDPEKSILRNTRIGFIFQNYHLVPHMSVRDNILLPSLYRKKSIFLSDSVRMEHLPELLGIEHLLDRDICELSGGQKQRIAVARALLYHPDLILADEPTGNLDPGNTAILMELFKELKQQGKTILMVTHDPSLRPFGDRIVDL